MVEGGMLAEGENSVFKVDTNEGGSLTGQLLAGRTSDNRRSQDESLERSERDAIYKSEEIKMPEGVPFTLVYAVAESVSEKRVTSKTLSFLDKETEGQRSGGVKCRRWGSQGETTLGMDDETTDEVKVGVETVLLGKLCRTTR